MKLDIDKIKNIFLYIFLIFFMGTSVFLFLENNKLQTEHTVLKDVDSKLKETQSNFTIIEKELETYKINTEIVGYISKISEDYKNKDWKNVVNTSTDYFDKLKNRADMVNPIAYLYSSYANYRLAVDNSNASYSSYMNNAYSQINNYIYQDKNSATAYFTRGLIELTYNSEDYINKAFSSFSNANYLKPSDNYKYHMSISLYRLSETYRENGDKEKQKKCLEEALKIVDSLNLDNKNVKALKNMIKNRLNEIK